ncbi:MAG: enoyl-CoA hydratase/isomerase family protein [SAR324 cluster bacterium]|nr:enoyl-CoA hydratase/isomerase family protein [SAR324 cluster bacterium]
MKNKSKYLQTQVEEGLLRVTINRPEKRNALSRVLLEDLRTTFQIHADDPSLKLAVLVGAGDKSFAAGGDLRDLNEIRTLDDARKMAEEGKAALNAIRKFPVPVIAVLNGTALGGGAELAVACDLRIAASDAGIGFVQGKLNISSAWGGGIDLIQIVGRSTALRLLGTSELLTPRQAFNMGLIDEIAEDEENLPVFIERFISPYLQQKPQVMRAFKALLIGARDGLPRSEMDAIETHYFSLTWIDEAHWQAADKLLSK